MVVDPPGTQLSHVSSPAKFVEVLDLMCNIQVPANFLKATEVRGSKTRCFTLDQAFVAEPTVLPP